MEAIVTKKEKSNIDVIFEKIYYFLKNKLGFDDIQTIALISSLVLLPISLFLGFFYTKISTFQLMFYITLGLDLIVIIYSVIKYKYFKNKRLYFIEEFENKKIEVKTVKDLEQLNPLEFECFVRELFSKQGYRSWTTKRTHDNGADVVAEKGNHRIVIQVKYSSRTVNPYAVYQTNTGRHNYKADRAILITNNEFTSKAKLDAQYYGIKLMDEHDISVFLRKNGSIKFTYN